MFDFYEKKSPKKKTSASQFCMVHASGSCAAPGVKELECGDIVEWRGVSEDRRSSDINDSLRVHDEQGNVHWIDPGQLTEMNPCDVVTERLQPGSFRV